MRILGYFPSYMRVPYLMFNDAVLSAMSQLGYHVIGASIDTKDYENDDAGLIWRSFEKFRVELDTGGSIVLAHDTHFNTVEVLVDNMLEEIKARGLRGMFLFFFSPIHYSSLPSLNIKRCANLCSCHHRRVPWRSARAVVSLFTMNLDHLDE